MEGKDKTDNKNDNRGSGLRFTSYDRYLKIMSGILLVALQIILLLLKAHFSKNSDTEKAIGAIKEAQGKLADLATSFETKLRYSTPRRADVDRVQGELDKERNSNATSHQ